MTALGSDADSDFIGESQMQFGRSRSAHETIQNCEQSSVVEDDRHDEVDEMDTLIVSDESPRCNGVEALLPNTEEGSKLNKDGIIFAINFLSVQFSF